MRRAFIDRLIHRSEQDESILLLTGDLGFSVVEPFEVTYPDRFVNCGVAEQSMASIAAGLAYSGHRVFTYSIANFATFRCLEQIRNDIAYHNLPVCIVAVGAGASYGTLGYSHHALEDVAVMRAVPGIRIYTPADSMETAVCVDEILSSAAPAYLRLGRDPESQIHAIEPDISSGFVELSTGTDVTLLVSGPLIAEALAAAKATAKLGIKIQVVSVPRLRPLETLGLRALAAGRPIATLEEHSVSGGLGSEVLEALAAVGDRRAVMRLGYPTGPLVVSGRHSYVKEAVGLSGPGVVANIVKWAESGFR